MSRHWMPLYVADYLADTAHLSAAESGAYLHLIMHYWQAGKLPTNDRQLARIARMSDGEWAEARDVIAAFFTANWQHERIAKELATSTAKYEKRAAAGRKGGLQNGKTEATKEQCSSNASAGLNQPQLHSSVPEETIADAMEPAAPQSPEQLLWSEGVPSLIALGAPAKQARQMIGLWLKDTGGDHTRVLGAIQRAREMAISDPIPWLTAGFKKLHATHRTFVQQGKPNELASAFDRLDARIAAARSGVRGEDRDDHAGPGLRAAAS